jgi:hypothetical protein
MEEAKRIIGRTIINSCNDGSVNLHFELRNIDSNNVNCNQTLLMKGDD